MAELQTSGFSFDDAEFDGLMEMAELIGDEIISFEVIDVSSRADEVNGNWQTEYRFGLRSWRVLTIRTKRYSAAPSVMLPVLGTITEAIVTAVDEQCDNCDYDYSDEVNVCESHCGYGEVDIHIVVDYDTVAFTECIDVSSYHASNVFIKLA